MVEESLWKIAAILLAVMLLVINPLLHQFRRQEDIMSCIVHDETQSFVDRAREVGYISDVMWRQLQTGLGVTGLLYDIEIEHYTRTAYPIYDDLGNFTDRYDIHYEGVYTLTILENIDSQGKYTMGLGDYLYITVKNRSATKAQVLGRLFQKKTAHALSLYSRGGGMVKYDSD